MVMEGSGFVYRPIKSVPLSLFGKFLDKSCAKDGADFWQCIRGAARLKFAPDDAKAFPSFAISVAGTLLYRRIITGKSA